MNRWDDLLQEAPPKDLEQRIFAAVGPDLQELRKKSSRRTLLMWLGPATAAVAGWIVWEQKHGDQSTTIGPEFELAEFSHELELDPTESIELLSELDVLEELEVLEKWTNS